MTIGEKIKFVRETFGFSQKGLANMIGFSRQAVTKWENETALPDIYNLEKVLSYFDLPIAKFLNEDEPVNVIHIKKYLGEDFKGRNLKDRDILKKYFNKFFTIYRLELVENTSGLKSIFYKYLNKKKDNKTYYLLTKKGMNFLLSIDKVSLIMEMTRIYDDADIEAFEYGGDKFINVEKIGNLVSSM